MQTSVDRLEEHEEDCGRSSVAVLVVHAEEIIHLGWRLLLSRQSWVTRCLPARDRVEAIELVSRYEPHVAIVNLDDGHQHAAEDIAALHQVAPGLPVLLVSGATGISARALGAMGATGVVAKALPAEDLASAVRTVASGKRLFAISTPPGIGRLSDRETEVLGMLTAGATNREIASLLVVSPETVKRHVAKIFRKLGVRNRTEAAQRGHEAGLTAPAMSV